MRFLSLGERTSKHVEGPNNSTSFELSTVLTYSPESTQTKLTEVIYQGISNVLTTIGGLYSIIVIVVSLIAVLFT